MPSNVKAQVAEALDCGYGISDFGLYESIGHRAESRALKDGQFVRSSRHALCPMPIALPFFLFSAFRIFSHGIVPPYRTTTGPISCRGIGPYGPEAEFLKPIPSTFHLLPSTFYRAVHRAPCALCHLYRASRSQPYNSTRSIFADCVSTKQKPGEPSLPMISPGFSKVTLSTRRISCSWEWPKQTSRQAPTDTSPSPIWA